MEGRAKGEQEANRGDPLMEGGGGGLRYHFIPLRKNTSLTSDEHSNIDLV